MTEHAPRYRFRGSVEPSAAVARPVAVTKAAAGGSGAGGSSATLDIFDCIDSWGGWWGISAGDVDRALQQIGDVDTLYVRLNSPGGEATEGVAIANLLRAHKANVRVTVYGLAASAASYIACAGDVVNMGPGSLMFVHDAWDIALGDAADMRKAADALDVVSDSIAGLYAMKAGGTTAQWRTAMTADTWYSAESAVAAKLADAVGIDSQMPAGLPPVEDPDEDDDPDIEIEIDVEISPAARAAARRFDLSMLPNAPAALAPKAPAEQPVTPPTPPEEADTMSDTIPKVGLIKALGLADDAGEDTILDAVDGKIKAADKPDDGKIDPQAAKAALEADGKVVVSSAYLDELKAGADAGRTALARQRAEDRDKAIAKAQEEGKIGRSDDTVKAWAAAWDRDPDGTAKEIADLGVRFPVAKAPGAPGGDSITDDTVFSDGEAAALAAMTGTSKEALTR